MGTHEVTGTVGIMYTTKPKLPMGDIGSVQRFNNLVRQEVLARAKAGMGKVYETARLRHIPILNFGCR